MEPVHAPIPLVRLKRIPSLRIREPGDRPSLEDLLQEARQRHRSATRVEARVDLSGETTFYAGFADDLSDGGLFVATVDVLPIGTPVTLCFQLPCGHRATVTGDVAWVREPQSFDDDLRPGMAIAFDGLDARDRAPILRFLRHRPPLFWPGDTLPGRKVT